MGPVKELFSNDKMVRLAMALVSGTWPTSKLDPSESSWSPWRPPIAIGTVPCSPQDLAESTRKVVRLPMPEGMLPRMAALLATFLQERHVTYFRRTISSRTRLRAWAFPQYWLEEVR